MWKDVLFCLDRVDLKHKMENGREKNKIIPLSYFVASFPSSKQFFQLYLNIIGLSIHGRSISKPLQILRIINSASSPTELLDITKTLFHLFPGQPQGRRSWLQALERLPNTTIYLGAQVWPFIADLEHMGSYICRSWISRLKINNIYCKWLGQVKELLEEVEFKEIEFCSLTYAIHHTWTQHTLPLLHIWTR